MANSSFEQHRSQLRQKRLAEISGEDTPESSTESPAEAEQTIEQDEAKRARFRACRARLQQERLQSMNKSSTPSTPPSPPPPPLPVDSNTAVPPILPFTSAQYGAKVKTDIGKIEGQINNSGLRSLVSQYSRLVSPFFCNDKDSGFPTSLRQHGTNPERCKSSNFGDCVLFHIGRAILAYYAIESGDYTEKDLTAIQFLHDVAVIGVTSHKVKGGDQRGFMLFATDNHERILEG